MVDDKGQQAGIEPDELKALLSDAALREKRSRKRAIVYTVVPVIIGIVFLGVALHKVSQLQQTASNLNGQIESKTDELKRKKIELTTLEVKSRNAEDRLELATRALSDIGKDRVNPQQTARETLQVLSTVRHYDGSLSLEALTFTLQSDEANLIAKLVLLEASKTGTPSNYASFQEVSISEASSSHITLIELTQPSDLTRLVAQGRTLIFESTIYVRGQLTKIAAFR